MSKSNNHYVLFIPGLSDRVRNIEFVTRFWKAKGLIPYMFPVGWKNQSQNIASILSNIIETAELLAKENTVSIVGTSAGGSVAFNALIERPDIIHKAVNVCGRLRSGNHSWRSLERMSKSSPAFKESVLKFERNEPYISNDFLSRTITVSARFGDELVPLDTSQVEGSTNITIPTIEHVASIGMALTVFSKPIIEFLRENS